MAPRSTPPHTVAGSFVAAHRERIRLGDELTVVVTVRCTEERVTARGDRAVTTIVHAEVLEGSELTDMVGKFLADTARARGDGVHPGQTRLEEVAESQGRHPSAQDPDAPTPVNRVSASRLKAAGLTQPEYLAACELVAERGWTVAAPMLEQSHSPGALELVRATIGQTRPHALPPLPKAENGSVAPLAGRKRPATKRRRATP